MKLPRGDKEKGSVGIIFLLTLAFVLIPLTGLAIDATILYIVKTKLCAAVDAAALAAGRSLSVGLDIASQQASAQTTAQAYFDANFPKKFWNATATMDPANVQQSGAHVRTVTITARATVPTIFMEALGVPSTVVSDSGQASRRDVNVIMVLDRSGSMAASGSCGPMKAAAQQFVNMFSNGRDTLGLITFMQSANLDYAPNQQFQTTSPTLDDVIGQLVCTSSTATADALHLAYTQIQAIDQPGALNVILLFTDGIPNGVRAHYPMSATSKCQVGLDLFGSIADGGPTSGVLDATGVSDSSQPLGVIKAPGCAFSKNSNAVDQDVAYIGNAPGTNHDQDAWGNYLLGGYASTNGLTDSNGHVRPDLTSAIDAASINAAYNQARTIRYDATYQPIIYTIGYGSDVDKTLLIQIANDPSSVKYDPSIGTGLFVFAPDKSALAGAFNTIASQILRLSH